jgi:hypothetical protein
LFYYGFDLREWIIALGTETPGMAPSFVLSLIQRLPDTSLTAALASGGREHFGWGVDRHMNADIFDAINQNTRATGNWSKKPPKIEPRPRPGKGVVKKAKASVADLFARMTR